MATPGTDPDDIYHNGSYYNRTTGGPAPGYFAAYFQNGLPFIIPSSGSVAVTTGAITLSVALDKTYAQAYMYFPANTFTGSTAGFYYVVMSSTTLGTMYQDKYTSGQPMVPTSPSLVTTGAGAYVQTTGSYVDGPSFTIKGGTMGANGRLYCEMMGPRNNSATGAGYRAVLGSTDLGAILSFSTGACAYQGYLVNQNNQAKQVIVSKNFLSGGANIASATENTATDLTFKVQLFLGAATDYVVCGWSTIQINK